MLNGALVPRVMEMLATKSARTMLSQFFGASIMRVGSSVSALLLVLSGAAAAQAAGLSIARFGGEHGTPMTTNATAIYYNPAGIGWSEGGHVFADLGVAWRHAVFEHFTATSPVPPGAEGANTGRATLFNVFAEPLGGATYRLGDFAIGAAYFIPFGGQELWNQNDAFRNNTQYPGAVDGVQRWYTIDGAIRSTFLSVAGAYRLGPVAFGVAGNLIHTIVNNVQARDPTGGDDLRNEGRAWIDAQSWDLSAGFGITYQAIPRVLVLGASYQSRPGFGGGIRTTGELHTIFAGGTRNTEKIAFTTDLPDVIRAGAAYRPLDRLELRLFGDYQTWSVLEHQCLYQESSTCHLNPDGSAQPGSNVILNYKRDWHDTFGVRVGASYWTSPDVELFAGTGYSSNAIPSSTLEPGILDFNLITASVGGSFRLSERFRLTTTYLQVFYLPRDTTGESIHPRLAAPSRSPDSSGKYSLQVGYLDVNLDFAF